MKRATGRTDSPQAQNRVSIQLTLGGHSFSAESLRAAAEKLAQAGGKAPVGVEVLTEKTQLVPREEFAAETAGAYLRVAGTGCGAHEIPVWSDPARPVVAVMAADAEAVGMLREKFGGRLRFVSPLLSEPALPPRAGSCFILRYTTKDCNSRRSCRARAAKISASCSNGCRPHFLWRISRPASRATRARSLSKR